MDRRTFLQTSSGAALASCMPLASQKDERDDRLETHIFSKHLQFLPYEEMAVKASEIGFDGVELTVRPKGHVEPAEVRENLPRAVAAVRKAGLKATMVASDVNNVSAEHNSAVLESLVAEGIKTYRMRYYRYPKTGDILPSVLDFRSQAEELVRYNEENGLQAVYQNHAGPYFGSSMWEIRQMCEGFDPAYIGCQYDLRHATVEGGLSWQKELRVILPYINGLVIKDFVWEKQQDGQWKVQNVPLGEGMADFNTFFGILKANDIKVPISLHLEYPLHGANHGDRDLTLAQQEDVYAAMRRDLEKLHMLWAEA
ncbi:MAG: sugar phosphate isomerase/epimerase [Saprospiraceae bacterium]|nr:sugar phosphate isomerase/epimerase [Saprospiraceae bacterium]